MVTRGAVFIPPVLSYVGMPSWSPAPLDCGYARLGYRLFVPPGLPGAGASRYKAFMLDVAIVGGGPSRHPTALPPGTRAVVVEKERYPREKICAGGIGARAFRKLEKRGVEVDCPRVRHALALRFER